MFYTPCNVSNFKYNIHFYWLKCIFSNDQPKRSRFSLAKYTFLLAKMCLKSYKIISTMLIGVVRSYVRSFTLMYLCFWENFGIFKGPWRCLKFPPNCSELGDFWGFEWTAPDGSGRGLEPSRPLQKASGAVRSRQDPSDGVWNCPESSRPLQSTSGTVRSRS